MGRTTNRLSASFGLSVQERFQRTEEDNVWKEPKQVLQKQDICR